MRTRRINESIMPFGILIYLILKEVVTWIATLAILVTLFLEQTILNGGNYYV